VAAATRDPFHDGEQHVQELAGEREIALRTGGILSDEIPPRAIPFLAQQRMLAVGSVEEGGAVWASLLFGARGLASSPDGRSVVIDRTRLDVAADDPLWSNLRVGGDAALLAIELETRRRLRINGVVSGLDHRRVEVSVREAYPNCPKYIQRRRFHDDDPGARSGDRPSRTSGVTLDAVRSLVERADTFFVASRHPTRGVDVSHRGGMPGFVRILDADGLRIPDYRGNSMFNTLGNFTVDEHAGLAFLDFERGRILQMTGTAALRFGEEDDPRQPTGGTGRYWDFHVARWLTLPIPKPLAWELLEYSPHNPVVLT
jgi:predicted pyridoxine 5'-phosphate oxidase superfamily flavin-nucleotide-binding protein